MKFNVSSAYDWGYHEEVEINSLDELNSFVRNKHCPVTVSYKFVDDAYVWFLKIDDSWKEYAEYEETDDDWGE